MQNDIASRGLLPLDNCQGGGGGGGVVTPLTCCVDPRIMIDMTRQLECNNMQMIYWRLNPKSENKWKTLPEKHQSIATS